MFGAIDIGGTKTLLATFSREGKLLKNIRFETPKTMKIIQRRTRKTVKQYRYFSKLKVVIGLAVPGLINRR